MSKTWSRYFTQQGLVFNGDEGDSCRETGTYICFLEKQSHREVMFDCLEKCHTEQGWVRSPYSTVAWHRDPKEFSRDQWVGMMCAVIMTLPYLRAESSLLRTWVDQRFMMAQNGDLITWEHCLWIRTGKYGSEGKVFLWILDLGFVINVLIRLVKSRIDPLDTADDINLGTMAHVFSKHMPTFWTKLGTWLYRYRKNGVLWAWQKYYERDEAPPMPELAEPILRDLHLD